MAVNATGKNYIDSLIKFSSWTGNTGQATTIAYNFSFAQQEEYEGAGVPKNLESSYVAALQEWANVANVKFTPNGSTEPGMRGISFAHGDLGVGTLGLTVTKAPVNGVIRQVALVLDDRFGTPASVAKGSLGYFTLVHEVGHALGLEHPGPYSGGEMSPHLPSNEDNIQNTVMSYNNGPLVDEDINAPSGPMIYDIAAMQYLYGANRSYNAGNTTYNLTGANSVRTLWDGAGNDTIKTSVSYGGFLDLREGIDFYSKVGSTYLWNAFGANIENATGGSGADTIYGNGWGNLLNGNSGNDKAWGGNGNDTMVGGAGHDYLNGQNGNDVIAGGDGADTIHGGNNNDALYGDAAANVNLGVGDIIYGGAGNDTVVAGGGNDKVYGDDGNDSLSGNDGNDILVGGLGVDTLLGSYGNDVLYGDLEANGTLGSADLIYGNAGNDTIYSGGGNDNIFGQDGSDFIWGAAGSDNIYCGAGNDIFYYGAADVGTDRIYDFSGAGPSAGDMIRVASANMNGNGLMTTADLASAVVYSSGNATLNLGGGVVVTLVGVSGSLTANDFTIG